MAYVSIESGIIHVEAEMSWDNVASFLSVLREMEVHHSVATIVVHLSCLGGATLAAASIAQALRTCTKPVRTVGTGYIASAGVHVLAAGHPGKRQVTADAMLMLHAPRIPRPDANFLTMQELKAFTTGAEAKVDHYYTEMANLTAKPAAFWRQKLDDRPDWFITPVEAVARGLVDKILRLNVGASDIAVGVPGDCTGLAR